MSSKNTISKQSTKSKTFLTNCKDTLKAPFAKNNNTVHTIVWNAIFVTILAVILYAYAGIANRLIEKLVGNRTSQQILNQLLMESPEMAQQFLTQIQTLIIYSIVAAIIIAIIALLFYIFTREKVYTKQSLKQSFNKAACSKAAKQAKQYLFKWIATGILATITIVLTSIVLLILRSLVQFVVQQITQNTYHTNTLMQVLNPYLLVVVAIIVISAEIFFTKSRKAWEAFGLTLQAMAKNILTLITTSLVYFIALAVVYFGFIRVLYQSLFSQTVRAIIDLIFLVLVISLLKESLEETYN